MKKKISKVRTITRKISVPPGAEVKVLAPKDLNELTLRRQTLQSAIQALQMAQFNRLMIEEAYQSRVATTLEQYGCKGQYDIDLKTGAITPRKVGGNG